MFHTAWPAPAAAAIGGEENPGVGNDLARWGGQRVGFFSAVLGLGLGLGLVFRGNRSFYHVVSVSIVVLVMSF